MNKTMKTLNCFNLEGLNYECKAKYEMSVEHICVIFLSLYTFDNIFLIVCLSVLIFFGGF